MDLLLRTGGEDGVETCGSAVPGTHTLFFIIDFIRLRPSLSFHSLLLGGRIIALPSGNKCSNAMKTLGSTRKQEEGAPFRFMLCNLSNALNI